MFQPTKMEKRLLLYFILDVQAAYFYRGFYNALDIFNPKIKMLSHINYFKNLIV